MITGHLIHNPTLNNGVVGTEFLLEPKDNDRPPHSLLIANLTPDRFFPWGVICDRLILVLPYKASLPAIEYSQCYIENIEAIIRRFREFI